MLIFNQTYKRRDENSIWLSKKTYIKHIECKSMLSVEEIKNSWERILYVLLQFRIIVFLIMHVETRGELKKKKEKQVLVWDWDWICGYIINVDITVQTSCS